MIVDSSLECLQTYHTAIREVTIIPGRNLIPDDVGRALMSSRVFTDMVNAKAHGYAGKLLVVVPPAPEPQERATAHEEMPVKGKGGKFVKGGAKGKDDENFHVDAGPKSPESPTSNRTLADAISDIRECDIVDQLQEIMLNDPRPEIRNAAEQRIHQLAQEALNPEKGDAGA